MFNFAERDNLATQLWTATNIPIDIIKSLLSSVHSYDGALGILQTLESTREKLTYKHREQLRGDCIERDLALNDLLGEDVALKLGSKLPMISQIMANYLLN
jgi:hypothetical protein